MLLHQLMYGLTALLVSHLGHRTRVHHTNISLLPSPGCPYAGFLQQTPDGGGFRKVQFAAQRIIYRRLILKYVCIYHIISVQLWRKGTHYYYNAMTKWQGKGDINKKT